MSKIQQISRLFFSLTVLFLIVCIPMRGIAQLVPPTTSDVTIMCGETATLTASGSTGIYVWYADSQGTQQLHVGSTFITPELTQNTTYYVAAADEEPFSTSLVFTNCGATGSNGPTQANVNSAYSGTDLEGQVTVQGNGIQLWTVPVTGTYEIAAYGAQGGSGALGGLGAMMSGEFVLNQGDQLKIIVGQVGGTNSGGGGTYVALADNTPLIVAGGGGGGNQGANLNGGPGLTTNSGTGGGISGVGFYGGAGGGGFNGNGQNGENSFGGQSFINGGQGGVGGAVGNGGFGGGASSSGDNYGGAGGGGGYNGGNGYGDGTAGDGGGSFNSGTSQNNATGVNSNHGYVTIDFEFVANLSALVPANVFVILPEDPTVTIPPTIECGETAILTASGSTGEYVWYSDSQGTEIVGTGATFETPPVLSPTTYYVAASTGEVTITTDTLVFTNAGAIGRLGPTQMQVDNAYSGTSLEGLVTVTGQGVQNWVVPHTGTYIIEAYGAEGGDHPTNPPGLGVKMSGEFELTQGQELAILVGQKGGSTVSSWHGAGGGGGSFVWDVTQTDFPLIAAGGGAGGGNNQSNDNKHATININGQANGNGSPGGVNGQGGGAGDTGSWGGGGGAGWLSNGLSDGSYGQGGTSPLNGGQGGPVAGFSAVNEGGYGGGGSDGYDGGAGGGGFSGGRGGGYSGHTFRNGGGGGSYNAGANQDNQEQANSGHGYVVIISTGATALCVSNLIPVPIDVNLPDLPLVSQPDPVPCGTTATITASGSTGTYAWFADSQGTQELGTGAEFETPELTENTTFWVAATNNECVGNYVSVTVEIIPLEVPVVSGPSIILCGESAILTATGGTGNYVWFTDPQGDNLIGDGSPYTTPPLTEQTTFYVAAAAGSGSLEETFTYTGNAQAWTVPFSGEYTVELWGAQGGNITSYYPIDGGLGGYATGTITLTAGETIYFYVGGKGEDRLGDHPYPSCTYVEGGWNGGGATSSAGNSTPGGGASDIRVGGQALTDRVIVAGGGGGGGWTYAKGGDGGGLNGENGTNTNQSGLGAFGGTQLAGGAVGAAGTSCGKTPGSLGQGGDGGGSSAGGGGGGGGYYGGGGGGFSDGGGGGSSYIGGVSNGATTTGVNTGNGLINISFEAPLCLSDLVPITVDIILPDPPTVSGPTTVMCGEVVTLTAAGSTGEYAWFADAQGTEFLGEGTTFETPSILEPVTYWVGAVSGELTIVDTLVFTNAGSTGFSGPSQADINSAYAGTPLEGEVTVIGDGIQRWTVPFTGTYTITAAGAQGGGASGGLGAVITGDFELEQGQEIDILVGQRGDWNGNNVGGGGGTFVVKTGGNTVDDILVIAGGGGGSAGTYSENRHAVITAQAQDGAGAAQFGAGGANGNGGGATQRGGGGGGFFTDGQDGTQTPLNCPGGKAFLNGGLGAIHQTSQGGADGGFGGGGATWETGFRGAGGAGGFSGGGAGQVNTNSDQKVGGGGGSYNNGSNPENTPAINQGQGYVVISSSSGAAMCVSSLVSISITIEDLDTPVISEIDPIPCGSSAVIAPQGITNEFMFFADPQGNELLYQGEIFITPELGETTTFYVASAINECFGEIVSITIETIPLDPPTVSGPTTVLCGEIVTLTAAGSTGEYAWFADAQATQFLGEGVTFETQSILQPTTFWVGAIAGEMGLVDTLVFTNAGATGYSGPSQADINSAYAGTPLEGEVTVIGDGIQRWTVPFSGSYVITALGAQGGGDNGGLGARISGEFELVQGQEIDILVGQRGDWNGNNVGGGGGTYVVKTGGNTVDDILVIAGGGGGSAGTFSENRHAVITTQAQDGAGTAQFGVGGVNGNGGGATQRGGGGGGFFTDGQDGTQTPLNCPGGKAFLNGGLGAQHQPGQGGADGGFGGGGATWETGFRGGGGAGGFSGGGAGQVNSNSDQKVGGGGGSYNNGDNQENTQQINSGQGYVLITSASGAALCMSDLVSITINIQDLASPTVNDPAPVPCGDPVLITPMGGTGFYTLFEDPQGEISITSGEYLYLEEVWTNVTYYVGSTVEECHSDLVPVNLTVINYNPPTVSAPPPIECGNTALITASGSSGHYAWYEDPEGEILLSNEATFETPILSETTTFYVGANTGQMLEADTITFTNCGAIGRLGPTQVQVNNTYAGTVLEGNVTVTGDGVQNWTVPASGTYIIRAFGAEGGNHPNSQQSPGLGVMMSGEFELTQGQELAIIVGQKGGNATQTFHGAGGGGASWVWDINNPAEPLIAAGGGAGGGNNTSGTTDSKHATIEINGQQNGGGAPGGVNGQGGGAGNTGSWGGGGGAGWLSNGLSDGSYGQGGISPSNGGQGGPVLGFSAVNEGGFGGGGSDGYDGGAGGGGYSGGRGGGYSGHTFRNGGGGGSYNAGENQDNQEMANTGNGYVQFIPLISENSCESDLVAVTVIVNPLSPPTAENGYICEGGSTTLEATGSTGHYYWYSDPQGQNNIGTGAFYTTPVLSEETVYYVSSYSDIEPACVSQPIPVIVQVDMLSVIPTSLSGGGSYCYGSEIILDVVGGELNSGAEWEWFEGGCGSGDVIGLGTPLVVYPDSATTYFVRAAAVGACAATGCVSTTVNIDYPPSAPTEIDGPSAICIGDTITLTAIGGTDGDGAIIQWFENACGEGDPIGTGETLTVTPTQTTTYFVRRVGTTSCANNTECVSLTVTVDTPPTAPTDISGFTDICDNEATTLTAFGGSEGSNSIYLWYIGGCGSGDVIGTEQSITVEPNVTTTYYVRRIGNNGCTNVTDCASITVNVSPANTLTMTSAQGTNNQSVCNNNPIIDISYYFTGATDVLFDGLPSGVVGSYTGNVITISGSPNQYGVFYYTVTLIGGCGDLSAEGTITNLENVFHIELVTENVSCYNRADGSAMVTVSGGSPPYNLYWLSNGQLIAMGKSANLLNAGTYQLSVEDKTKCVDNFEFIITQPDRIDVEEIITDVSCRGYFNGRIEIEVSGGVPPYEIYWNTGDTALIIESLKKGRYYLNVIDSNLCEENLVYFISESSDFCLKIPNAFTPNGDGVNDVWEIEYLDKYPDAVVNIFNRWGQHIYQGRTGTEFWDGTWNGKLVPTGSYIYVIDLDNNPESDTEPLIGTVTVVY